MIFRSKYGGIVRVSSMSGMQLLRYRRFNTNAFKPNKHMRNISYDMWLLPEVLYFQEGNRNADI